MTKPEFIASEIASFRKIDKEMLWVFPEEREAVMEDLKRILSRTWEEAKKIK